MKRERSASVSLKRLWFWREQGSERCLAVPERSKAMLSSILNFRVGGDKAEGMAGRRACCVSFESPGYD